MLTGLTNRLLWDKQLAPHWQRVWVAALLLAPLALAAALWMQWTIAGRVPARIPVDRETVLESAHRFLETKGIDVTGWDAIVDPTDDLNTYRYLVRQKAQALPLLQGHGAWLFIRTQFDHPEGSQSAQVTFSPDGSIVGWKLTYPDEHNFGQALPEADAQHLAEHSLAVMLQPHPYLKAEKCAMSTRTGSGGTQHSYSCEIANAGWPQLQANIKLQIRGGNVVEQNLSFELSDSAARAVRPGKSIDGFFISLACVLFVFMMVRYFKRRAQKEVSRQRMLVVTLIIGCFVMAQVLLEDEPLQINNVDVQIPSWLPIVLFGLGAYIAGQAAGVAYAAAEGDLREKRACSLVSLDALLSGRLFSRNVGRSIVLGTVILSWMLLLRNAVYLGGAPEFAGIDTFSRSYSFLFSRLPWLSLIIAAISMAVFKCLLALLCPLAVFERRLKRPRFIVPLLIAAAWITIAYLSHEPLNQPWTSVSNLIQIAGIFLSFFAVDLLAALTLTTGFSFYSDFIGLAHISTAWTRHQEWAIGIAGVWILIQTISAFKGRIEQEADVRPEYAHDIHERQQLESEIEAAKEAQQRLLPAGPPKMEGLSLAASCRANETVSGDFYDYFPISSSKLGILICDGGGNGLATALTIALAKGFLMHKAQAGLSPLDTLRALRLALGNELKSESTEGLVYAVVDVQDRSLRFARYGETPSVFLAGADCQMTEIRHGGAEQMWEGYGTISPQTRAIIYTNGVTRLIGEHDRESTNRWLMKRIHSSLAQPARDLHATILKLIFKRRSRKATDDITVIVCQIESQAKLTMEHVA